MKARAKIKEYVWTDGSDKYSKNSFLKLSFLFPIAPENKTVFNLNQLNSVLPVFSISEMQKWKIKATKIGFLSIIIVEKC